MVRRKEQTTCERRGPLAHPPSLGFLGALGRWHSAARTERVSGNAAPGRLLSRSGLRANQNGLMPRRGWQEIKVKAPDTMGPLSVSSQLTFKQRFHPPSPLLPIPSLAMKSPKPTASFQPLREGSRTRDPTPDGRGWVGPGMVCHVHQVATEHRTSEGGEGARGPAAKSSARAETLPFPLKLKKQVR